jgi:alpha-tubulin suppressor-like RCC1 family protein
MTNAVAVAAGGLQSLALSADGTVSAWGTYFDGTNSVPVAVPAGLSNVAAIAAGTDHCLALKSNGTVVAWGTYYNGWAWAPMPVPSGLTNVVAIACGGYQCLALRAGGAAVAWGTYFDGSAFVPVVLPSTFSNNVAAIAAGSYHCLALKSNRTVVASGTFFNGSAWMPMTAPTGLTKVGAIAAGSYHCLAQSNGTVVAWGTTYDGSAYMSATAPATLSSVATIAAGGFQSLALSSNGTLAAWGTYHNGSAWAPASVPPGLTNVVAIAAGYYHSLAITLEPLIVSPPPPIVSMVFAASTNLSVSVWSRTNFDCQWYFNGSALSATDLSLSLNQFDAAKAGVYSATVSNQFDSATVMSIVRLTNSPIVLVDGIPAWGGTVVRTNLAQITVNNTFGANAHLFYTLDGSAPTLNGVPYVGPFTLMSNATLRVIAYHSSYTNWSEAAPVLLQVWPLYPLLATTAGGGTVTVTPPSYDGRNNYVSNTPVTLTASTNSGWSFLGWTGDTKDTTNVTTFLLDRPRAVQAVFGTPLDLFTNGNGYVDVNPPNSPYPYGSTVQLTARPAPNAYFFGWANGASGFANPLSLMITNGARAITALFGTLKADQVSLTVLPSGLGTVFVSPAKNVYTNGETVTLTAMAFPDYVFGAWSGDASGTSNRLSLTLDSSKFVTANFIPYKATNPPRITRSPGSRTLGVGSTSTLSLEVTGDPPFSYHWRRNGSTLAGATDSSLVLGQVTAAQAGLYDVIVTGAAGAATSAPASVALFRLGLVAGENGTAPLLILDAAPGITYRLDASSDPSFTNSTSLVTNILQNGQLYYVDDPVGAQARRFYRAVPQ